MFNGTILQQGKYTADGTAKILKIRSDIDWMEVVNYTNSIATDQNHGIKYYWQRGMASTGIGLVDYHINADETRALKATAVGAFTLIDSSTYAGGAWIATTVGTNATQPVYDTGATTNLFAGGIVRIKGTDQVNLNGRDFSVTTVNANVDFKLENTLATAPGIVAGAGFWKLIAPNLEIYRLFIPSSREVCKVTAVAAAVVTTLVDHGYSVGEKVRFKVPAAYGMIELDGLTGTITAITAGTFTTDIDSTGFTAFKFPTAAEAATALDVATVVPIGQAGDSASAALTGDAIRNQGFIGMSLAVGDLLPGGVNNDVIYWRAGKSFSNDS